MENKFTPELIEKAKEAAGPEELLALAAQNGVELTQEQAEEYYAKLHATGELADEELDNVAGGGCGSKTYLCPECGTVMEIQRKHFRKQTYQWYACAACGYRTENIGIFDKL